AVGGTPSDDPNHVVHLNNLASAHSERFSASGKSEDIDLAIHFSEQIAKSSALNSIQRPQCYFNLSNSYIQRLRRFGRDGDLESAQLWIQKAVDSAPLGHPDIPGFQRGLALTYAEKDQYYRYGDVADMESALHYAQAALNNVSPGDPLIISIQHAMAVLYRTKYRRLQEVTDLEAAISLSKAVVAATPNNHDQIGARLTLLAALHSDRYHKLGDREDRSAALRLYISSVELTPADHPDLPTFQSRLAIEYSNKYAMLREEEYLEAALKYMSASVEATPPGHRQRGYRESLLAQFHAQKSDSFRAPEDRERGLSYFRSAINAPNMAPSELWDAARSWAAFADTNQLPEALEAYTIALRTLPELLWLGSNISTRHESLVRHNVTSTTMQAVAASIHFGNLELAVEFLEQSLAITFQQLLDLREEFSALEAAHPELSTRLTDVSMELRKIAIINGGNDSDLPIATERINSDRQRRLATERDSILREVRKLESFENFLLPVPYSGLRDVSAHGPVIMVNCTSKRCDVLILLHPDKPIQRTPLKWSLVEEAEANLGKLRAALGVGVDGEGSRGTRYGRAVVHQKPDPKQAFGEVLAWLWAMVVSPVFECLRAVRIQFAPWTVIETCLQNGFNDGRLWWCPTGPFTYLPLHAAGPPNDFIQSYTSTLSALLDARKNQIAERKQPSVMVVALSQLAGGKASLPSVKEELLKIEATVGQRNVAVLANNQATLANVEAALPQSTWLHLACHGQQNIQDPLKSGLLLYDTKLELGKLMTTPLPHAEFVFMSACETAMGDPKMTNESLHLAGGMLFAGFKAAIGTMWSINDQDGPPVAEAVYNHTWGQGKLPSVTDTAEALHIAVNKLRSQNVPPHRWVPFIHIGI
ncbi:CHAT domain-containing protein, partial [Infundibulicybe gibba]